MRWVADGVRVAGTGVAEPGAVAGYAPAGEPRLGGRVCGDRPADVVDLGLAAARGAMDAAALTAADLDLIVFATSTSSRPTASDAHRLAAALGARCAAWDLRAGGAAGLLGWAQGACAVRDGARAALVVAAEVITPWLDPEHDTGLYADAAAALALTPGRGGLRSARSGHADPVGRPFTVPMSLPPRPGEATRASRPDAAYLARLAEVWTEARATLAADLDRPADALLPHAVTPSQVAATAAAVPHRALVDVLPRWGCAGAASPLLALREAPPGLLASVAVGGGIAWATLVWEAA